MVLEGWLANTLGAYLDAYFKDFKRDNISLGAWGGTVKLQNLQLKEDLLKNFGVPFTIKEGYVKSLNVQVALKQLLGEPIKVELDDVYLLVSPEDYVEYNAEEERKQRGIQLDTIETTKKQQSELAAAGGTQQPTLPIAQYGGMASRLTEKIQVAIRNVHLRVEDTVSNTKTPMAYGVMMKGLSIETTTDKWDLYVTNEETYLHKYVRLEGFSVYFETNPTVRLTKQFKAGSSVDLKKAMLDLIATEADVASDKTSSGGNHISQYIIPPFTSVVKIAIKMQGEVDEYSPVVMVDMEMKNFTMAIDGQQYHGLLGVMDVASRKAVAYQYRACERPRQTVTENPAAWWQYAIRAIQSDIDRDTISWKKIKRYRDNKKKLLLLRKQIVRAKGQPDPNVVAEAEAIEDTLDTDEALQCRLQAQREVQLEVQAQQQQAAEAAKQNKGWLSGWWGSGSAQTDEQKAAAEAEELRKHFMESLDPGAQPVAATQYTGLSKQYVAARMSFRLGSMVFSLRDQPGAQPLVHSVMQHMDTTVEHRPNAQGFTLTFLVSSLMVNDTDQHGNMFPMLISSHRANALPDTVEVEAVDKEVSPADTQWETTGPPVFLFQLETAPVGGLSDVYLKVFSQKLEIVYNPHTIARILAMLQPEQDVVLEDYALIGQDTLNYGKEYSRALVEYYASHHTTVALDVTLNAPLIIVPELPKGQSMVRVTDKDVAVLVMDLGQLHMTSQLHDNSATEKDPLLMLYDTYKLEFSDTQMLLAKTGDDWRAALAQDGQTSYSVLAKSQLSFIMNKCIQSQNVNYPSLIVEGTQSLVDTNISDKKYAQLMAILGAMGNAQAAVSPPKLTQPDDDTMSGEWDYNEYGEKKAKPGRIRRRRMMEGWRRASAISEEDVTPKPDPARPSEPIESVASGESFHSAHGTGQTPQTRTTPALHVPDSHDSQEFFDTSSGNTLHPGATKTSDEAAARAKELKLKNVSMQIKYKMERMALHLMRSRQGQSDEPVATIAMDGISFSYVARTYDMSVVSELQGFEVVDHAQPPDSSYRKIVDSNPTLPTQLLPIKPADDGQVPPSMPQQTEHISAESNKQQDTDSSSKQRPQSLSGSATSVEATKNLLLFEFVQVMEESPEFDTVYGGMHRTVRLGSGGLELNVDREALMSMVGFLMEMTTVPSEPAPTLQAPPSDKSRRERLDAPPRSRTISHSSLHRFTDLAQVQAAEAVAAQTQRMGIVSHFNVLVVNMATKGRPIASFSAWGMVSHVEFDPSTRTLVRASLRDMRLEDRTSTPLSEPSMYYKIIRSAKESEDLFSSEFEMRNDTTEIIKSGAPRGPDDYDMSAKMKINGVICVFLYRFISDLTAYGMGFTFPTPPPPDPNRPETSGSNKPSDRPVSGDTKTKPQAEGHRPASSKSLTRMHTGSGSGSNRPDSVPGPSSSASIDGKELTVKALSLSPAQARSAYQGRLHAIGRQDSRGLKKRMSVASLGAKKFKDNLGRSTTSVDTSAAAPASRIKLDVSIDAPTIIIPLDSLSKQMVIAQLGHLTTTNIFDTSPDGIPLDIIKVTLDDTSLYTAIGDPITFEGQRYVGLRSRINILQPVNIETKVVRSLNPFSLAVPHYDVEVDMKGVDMELTDMQYNLLLNIMQKNMAEKGMFSADTPPAPQPTSQPKPESTPGEPPAKEAYVPPADPLRANVKMTIGHVQMALSLASPKAKESGLIQEDPDRQELSRLSIHTIGLGATMDSIYSGTFSIDQIGIDDSRPIAAAADAAYTFRSVMATNKGSPDQQHGGKAPQSSGVVSVKFIMDFATGTQAYGADIRRVKLYFYSDYLRDILAFITPPAQASSPDSDKKEECEDKSEDEDDAKEVVEDRIVIGPKEDASPEKQEKDSSTSPTAAQPTPTPAAGPAEYTLKFSLNMSDSDIILMENRNNENTRAIAIGGDISLRYAATNNQMNVDLVTTEYSIKSFILRQRENTELPLLDPCSMHVAYSLMDGHTRIVVVMPDIKIQATYDDVTALQEMLASFSALYAAPPDPKGANTDEDVAPTDGTTLDGFVPHAVRDDVWYLRGQDTDTMSVMSVDSLGDTASVAAEAVVDVKEQVNVGFFEIDFSLWEPVSALQQMPLFRFTIGMEANAVNWSDKLIATATTSMRGQYFNKHLAVYEPLMEPYTCEATARPPSVHSHSMVYQLASPQRMELTFSSALLDSVSTFTANMDSPENAIDWMLPRPIVRATEMPCKVFNFLGVPATVTYGTLTKLLTAADMRLQLYDNPMDKLDEGINVALDGFTAIENIPVTMIGVSTYILKPARRGLDLRLAVEVRVENGIKAVILRSTLQVRNGMIVPMDVGCYVKNKGIVSVNEVWPGEVSPLPLLPAYFSKFYFRPTGFGYEWSKEPIGWVSKEDGSGSLMTSPSLTCHIPNGTTQAAGAGFFRSTVHLAADPHAPSVAAQTQYPCQVIELHPPFVMTNWLPFDIEIGVVRRPTETPAGPSGQAAVTLDGGALDQHDDEEVVDAEEGEGVAVAVDSVDCSKKARNEPTPTPIGKGEAEVEEWSLIRAGDKVTLYDVDIHGKLVMALKVHSDCTVRSRIKIPPILDFVATTSMEQTEQTFVQATDKNGTQLSFAVLLGHRNGMRDVGIMCPYWIVNRSGLPISIQDNSLAVRTFKDKAKTVFQLTKDDDGTALFSYADGDSNKKTVRVRVGPRQAGQLSEWSEPFGLDNVGQSGLLTLKARPLAAANDGTESAANQIVPQDHVTSDGLIYDLAVQIKMANTVSRQVVIRPRFLLYNKAHIRMEVAQAANIRHNGFNAEPIHSVSIEPGSHTAWYWHDEGTRSLVVRFGEDTCWSSPFPIDQPADHIIRMLHHKLSDSQQEGATASEVEQQTQLRRRAGHCSQLLQVHVSPEQGSFVVVMRTDKLPAPVRLENRCIPNTRYHMLVRQEGCNVAYRLGPGMALDYAYDVPSLPQRLSWCIEELDADECVADMSSPYQGVLKGSGGSPVYALTIPDAVTTTLVVTDSLEIFQTAMRNAYGVRMGRDTSSLTNSMTDRVMYDAVLSLGGFCLSLVDKTPREISYITMDGLGGSYTASKLHHSIQMALEKFQVDNSAYAAVFPSVIYPLQSPLKNPPPFFQFTAVRYINPNRPDLQQYKYVSVLVQPFAANVDLSFLLRLYAFYSDYYTASDRASKEAQRIKQQAQEAERQEKAREAATDQKNGDNSDRDSVTSKPADELDAAADTAGTGVPMYFNLLELHPISISLSVSLIDSEEGETNTDLNVGVILKAVGGVVGTLSDIDNSPLRLHALILEHTQATAAVLYARVYQHFYDQGLAQIYTIAGSVNFLGNPVHLFGSLSAGAKAFFYEPYEGIQKSPLQFGVGLVRGSKSLLTNTLGGTMSSLSAIAGTVGKGVAIASMDQQYQRERRMLLAQRPRDLIGGMNRGGVSFVRGVSSGITGVVLKPIAGAKSGGALGLLKGVGLGVAGLFAKPLSGMFDLASSTIAGLAATVDSSTAGTLARRARLPRYIAPDKQLRTYREHDADGAYFLWLCEDGKFRDETYVVHFTAEEADPAQPRGGTKRTMLMMTSESVLHFVSPSSKDPFNLKQRIRIEKVVSITYQPETKAFGVTYMSGKSQPVLRGLKVLNVTQAISKVVGDALQTCPVYSNIAISLPPYVSPGRKGIPKAGSNAS